MQRLPTAGLTIILTVIGALAAKAPCQDQLSQVSMLLAQADAATLDQAFEYGLQIVDQADDKQTDPMRDAVVEAAESVGNKGRIAAAVALQNLRSDTTYGRDIFQLLEPVIKSDNQQAQAAALALLGDERFFNSRILPDVRELLENYAKDELVAPRVRIEAAVSLWNVGNNSQRATAKSTLEMFLRSTDRELRIRGALALAELNVATGAAWALLRDVQLEPNDLGRRAKLYLDREKERREFERMLSRLVEARVGPPEGEEPSSDTYRVLSELRERIHANHVNGSSVKDEELIEYAAKGILMGLDPHSTYFTSDEFKKFFFDLNREYGGIGAFVNFDQDDDFSIVRPIYSGPAYEAGLRSGDKILEVDDWPTADETTNEIVSRLKGRPGTDVKLKVFRRGWQEPEDITIERRRISVPSVNHTMLPGDIGYLELVTFSSNMGRELDAALTDLMRRGAKGIVLDVRNNTGGFLSQARDVVERFVDGRELVVYTEGPAEPRREYRTRNRASCELPVAILTNNFSASASEITAGALQDLERAIVVGERTFGKGTVQNMMPLASDPGESFDDLNGDDAWQEGEPYDDRNGNGKFDVGAHIKLTIAKYYLPSGRTPHREFDKDGKIVDPDWGVTPDYVIDLRENKPEDAWKNTAVFALLKDGVFKDYVKKRIKEDPELFQQLADGDDGDWSKYPDFDAFYEGLETQLTKDDIRRWLRYEVRDQVSDLRGAVYPGQRALGDIQEDAQLQEALRHLLEDQGRDIREVEAYANILKIPFDDEEDEDDTAAKKDTLK